MIYLLVLIQVILGFLVPWWWVSVVVCMVYGTVTLSAVRAAAHSFLAVFTVWGMMSYYYDLSNGLATAQRLSSLFHLPHFVLVYPLIGLMGGIFAILGSLNGFYLRCFLRSPKIL